MVIPLLANEDMTPMLLSYTSEHPNSYLSIAMVLYVLSLNAVDGFN